MRQDSTQGLHRPNEYLRALGIAWAIVSLCLMTAVILPFILPESKIYAIFPPCEAKLRGDPCFLCGMTTAYVRLASGDISGALEANQNSIAFSVFSILNFAVVKAYILVRLLRRGFEDAALRS